MENETPDYLSYSGGYCDITLARPVTFANGIEQKVLRMREPTVDDQIVHDETKGSDAIREVNMFANLCEVAPEDVRKLSMKSYQRVQKAYAGFLD
ncbi:phage tail assembly protein [Halomonas sp. MES3-P3E]|uniref:phage tail assembly protein n=1 Tax=Halomonas sp. MES3-P3E TaxID=2058321 RepID=UPI000C32607C|nr:phage tail assembly protein [Halomonas sp. MES3-P3E]PKG50325.1 phage tail assembly protein [Halomonas sp. MES3-P3E]